MKQTVSVYEFRDAFRDMDRMAGWSYEGLGALYDYMEQYEEDCETEIELDVIALCCDFSEYKTALEAGTEYGFEPDRDQPKDELEADSLDWLRDNTTVIEFNGGVIIQGF